MMQTMSEGYNVVIVIELVTRDTYDAVIQTSHRRQVADRRNEVYLGYKFPAEKFELKVGFLTIQLSSLGIVGFLEWYKWS